MLAQGPAERLLHVRDDGVEVQPLRLHDVPAGEDQELAGQRRRALGRPPDLHHVGADRAVGVELLGDEDGVVEDDGEQVVEVVGDASGELAEALEALRLVELPLDRLLLKLLVEDLPLPLGVDAIGDVPDRRRDEDPFLGLDGAQADLHRDLAPILFPGRELEAGGHGPGPGVGEIRRPVAGVGDPALVGHEDLDRRPEQLVAQVPEEPLGLRVDEADHALPVDADDRVGGRLQQAPELGLGLLPGGDVPGDGRRADHPPSGVPDRGAGEGHVDDPSVLCEPQSLEVLDALTAVNPLQDAR